MVSCEVIVQSKVGLHSRPATCFVQKANEFKSVLYIEKEALEALRNLAETSFE